MLSIRTQDRMALVPYNEGIIITGYCPYTLKMPIDDLREIEDFVVPLELGTYATKERALEVLDEIEEAVCDNDNFAYNGTPDEWGKLKSVYQMPKE